MASKWGIKKIIDNLPKVRRTFNQLTDRDVYVGVPNEKAGRKQTLEEENFIGPPQKENINNAALLYIHDNGSAAAGIPARPVMNPGIQAVKGRIINIFKAGAKGVLSGNEDAPNIAYNAAGITAQESIRKRINEGPPPPLAPATIADRKRRGFETIKPLVVTAQMRNAVTYVTRKR